MDFGRYERSQRRCGTCAPAQESCNRLQICPLEGGDGKGRGREELALKKLVTSHK
jgi:hypothetical protein